MGGAGSELIAELAVRYGRRLAQAGTLFDNASDRVKPVVPCGRI